MQVCSIATNSLDLGDDIDDDGVGFAQDTPVSTDNVPCRLQTQRVGETIARDRSESDDAYWLFLPSEFAILAGDRVTIDSVVYRVEGRAIDLEGQSGIKQVTVYRRDR